MDGKKLTCEQADELLPEYALGALNSDETMAVAWHLRVCARHVAALDAYEAATVGLAASVMSVEPPSRLRARLLASVADRPGAARRAWLSWVVAAMAIVLAVGIGVWGVSLQRQIDRLAASRGELIALSQQPGAQMVALETTESGGAAKGVLIYSGGRAAIWAVALPPLQGDQVFACWWIDDANQPVLGGTFKPESGVGTWFVTMPENAENFHLMGITLEPNPHITQPQGPKVMGGEF